MAAFASSNKQRRFCRLMMSRTTVKRILALIVSHDLLTTDYSGHPQLIEFGVLMRDGTLWVNQFPNWNGM
jgi:hypothetical protein